PVNQINYGFVGDLYPDSVNTVSLSKLLNEGFTPVFSAITHDGHGQLLNTNADTLASALAVSLAALSTTSLVYCFEKKGVLSDVNDEYSVIPKIQADDFEELKKKGVIADGMIPKLHNAFEAITNGVDEVYIGHASDLHLLTQKTFGTRMTH